MQKVLQNLAPQVGNGHKILVDLGTAAATQSRNAISSAFALSTLPGSGWTIVAPNQVWIGYLLGAAVIWAVAYREGHATAAELREAIMTPPDAEPSGAPA